MNLHNFRILLLTCLALNLQAEFQQWESTGGHSFEGEFVRVNRDTVWLKGRDGKEVSVPLMALDPESREAALIAGGVEKVVEPVFSHETPKFRYDIRPDQKGRILQVQLLERGKPVPFFGDLRIRMSFTEYRTSEKTNKRKGYRQKIKEMIPEKTQNGNATFRIKYENDVYVIITTRSVPDGVAFSYTLEEPPGYPHGLQLKAMIPFPSLLEYDTSDERYKGTLSSEGVSFQDLDRFLDGYEIKIVDRKEQTTKVELWESPKGLNGKEITFSSPSFSDVRLEVEGAGRLNTGFYGGKKPVEGFGIHLANPQKKGVEMPEFIFRVR